MHQHSSSKQTLGISDVIAAGVLFWLITWGMQAGFDAAVPGLLKPETLLDIRLSGALFIIFWAVLGNFLVRPYIGVAIERENKTAGAIALAAENIRESKDILAQVEGALKQVRMRAIAERDAFVEAAKKEAQREYEALQSACEAERKKTASQIAAMKAQAQREIAAEADELSLLVVERALSTGTPVKLIH